MYARSPLTRTSANGSSIPRGAAVGAGSESPSWDSLSSMRATSAPILFGAPGGRRSGRCRDQAVELVGGALHERAHLVLGLAEAAQDVRGDDLGGGAVGPADPDPDPPEVRAAEAALERLEAVVARQAAAEPLFDAPEGQVDLVVHGHHAAQLQAKGSAGGADRSARVVHVGLGQQNGHARAARSGTALGVQAGVLLLGPWELPPLGGQRGHLEADVVASAGVAVAGVAEPDHQPIHLPAASATEEAQDSSPSASPSGASGASPSSAAAASAASTSSPTSSVSSSMSSGSSTSVGTTTVAMIVSSGSSRKVTPSGTLTSDRCMVAAIGKPLTSTTMASGIAVGSASMLSWWVTCSSTPPSLTPGASSAPSTCTPTVVWIFSSSRTSSRSMCITSSRTGWSCWSLTMTGRVWPPTSRSISAEPSTSTWRSTRESTLKDTESPSPPP